MNIIRFRTQITNLRYVFIALLLMALSSSSVGTARAAELYTDGYQPTIPIKALGTDCTRPATDYWFTWYDWMTMSTWLSIAAPDTNTASAMVDVYIGGSKVNPNPIVVPVNGQVTASYPGMFAGPVHVVSTNRQKIFVSERAIYGGSFAETLGIPGTQLTTDYWFTWYDWMTMNTWLSIGAPDTNTASAKVDIYIGGNKVNPNPIAVPVGGQVTASYPGMFAGPVHVVSTNGQKIFVSERAIYGGSFAETIGIPGTQLTADN